MKSILVTGCSSGIGHALAHGLKRRCWRVFASARDAADVARLAEEGLESLRPRARYPVTVPAKAFWWLQRLLPTRLMDMALLRASGEGKR